MRSFLAYACVARHSLALVSYVYIISYCKDGSAHNGTTQIILIFRLVA